MEYCITMYSLLSYTEDLFPSCWRPTKKIINYHAEVLCPADIVLTSFHDRMVTWFQENYFCCTEYSSSLPNMP